MTLIMSLIFLIGLLIAPDALEARKWRLKPSDLAADYTQIIDQRPDNDVVVIHWIAPETMDAGIQNGEAYRSMLREYVLVGVAHGNASKTGRLNFRAPDALTLQMNDGSSRKPLAKESWPPMVSAFSAVIQTFMTQSLGQLGEGFQWFVFEGKGIDSCGKGRFWIAYSGERYNYDTPIPGCPSGAPSK